MREWASDRVAAPEPGDDEPGLDILKALDRAGDG